MASDSDCKWDCPRCTYVNYQSSNFCIMCRSARESQFITVPPASASTSSSVTPAESCLRWPCPTCTFLNVLNSRNCALCVTSRPAEFEVQANKQSSADDEVAIDVEDAEKLARALHKWDCKSCTYKNWPSQKSCTMCGATKDLPQSQTAVGDENPAGSASGCNKNDYSASIPPFVPVDSCDTGKEATPGDDIPTDLTQRFSASVQVSEERLEADGSTEEVSLPAGTGEKAGVETADVATGTEEQMAEDGPLSAAVKRTMLVRHIGALRRTVDTGCVSFLEAVVELLGRDTGKSEKVLHYIYHYGESNRKITILESILLGGFKENDNYCALREHTLFDLFRSERRLIYNPVISRFFFEAARCSYTIPGLGEGKYAEQIYQRVRQDVYKDYDMCRIPNNGALFCLPSVVNDLRALIISGEHSLRVIMDFDERKMMKAICCRDTVSHASRSARHIFAPVALRNRGGGHSLVDAVSQALWGVVDKYDLLRDALFHTLYSKELMFRDRWTASVLKMYPEMTSHMLDRYWGNIMSSNQSGVSLEQIHILVLAQILNRAIIVVPIESDKQNPFPMRESPSGRHPVEGLYPQLSGLNNYRRCSPLLLGFSNGNFYALVMPPPSRSPLLVCCEGHFATGMCRCVSCLQFPLEECVQFALDEKEAELCVRDGFVVESEPNGLHWIQYSFISQRQPKSELSSMLWKEWVAAHFPKHVFFDPQEEVNEAEATKEDEDP